MAGTGGTGTRTGGTGTRTGGTGTRTGGRTRGRTGVTRTGIFLLAAIEIMNNISLIIE
jgi:hypothetical protein